MKNLFDINGNVTVITGGTGVLGRAIAKYLALNGAKVIILGRKEEIGKEIVDEITAEGAWLSTVVWTRCSMLPAATCLVLPSLPTRLSSTLTQPSSHACWS